MTKRKVIFMKRVLSIILALTFVCMCASVPAFADVQSSGWKVTDWGGVNSTYIAGSNFGKASNDNNQKLEFKGNQSTWEKTLSTPLQVSYGDKVKVSIELAMDADYSSNYAVIDLGMKAKAGTKSLTYDSIQPQFNPTLGSLYAKGYVTNLGTVAKNPVPAKTWVTYDIIYTIGQNDNAETADINEAVANTVSVYANGIPMKENITLAKSGANLEAITEVTGVYFFERGRKTPIYFDNVSLTYYPASGEDEPVLIADPMIDSDGNKIPDIDTNGILSIADNGSLGIADISTTLEDVLNLAPEGWTFSYVNADGTADLAEEGYLVMTDANGKTYYKKLISSSYKSLMSNGFTTPWTGHSYGYLVRRTSATGESREVLTSYEGKSADNNIVLTNFAAPAGGQINGFKATASGTDLGTNPHSNMIVTGKVAYEASVLIPSECTRDFIYEINYNGSMATGTLNTSIWNPIKISTDRSVALDGTPVNGFENFVFNLGEWYRFTAVVDTNTKTGEFYINGEKALTKEFESLDNVSYFLAGFSTRGFKTEDCTADAFSFAFDDVSIKAVRSDWSVPTLELTSNDEAVTIDNRNGVIYGSFDSAEAFASSVSMPEGATYAFYTDSAMTSAAAAGVAGRYLLVKNADETIIREYIITSETMKITGFDVSDVDTSAGEKTLTVSIENIEDASLDAMVAIASYNSGKLVAVDFAKKAAALKLTTDYTVTLSVTEEEPVTEIKAFLWDADNFAPILQNVSTNNN